MADDPAERRTDFLLEYYKVLWDNINRHIQGVWQTVATLGVSVALLALVGDGLLPLSLAAALIVGVCAWFSATVYDSALWFARNQVIATNIERLFLRSPEDAARVQPYFARGHREEPLISHFRIALWLSRGLVAIAVAYHFVVDVLPGVEPNAAFAPIKTFPYLALIGYLVVEARCADDTERSFKEQLRDGPGVPVEPPPPQSS